MLRSSLVILILALSASASAQNFDYSYLTLGYANTDFDELDADGDGFTVGGSYAFTNKLHGFAGYQTADLDSSLAPGGVDATRMNAGVGYNTTMSNKLDMFARLSYEYVDLDGGSGNSIDDSGLGFGVGLRFAASDQLELDAGIKYVDYGDLGDDTSLQVGGLYDFTDTFSLGLGVETSDDVTTIALSGRFYFGK
jgi:opacity protein-like surface antigen